MKGTLILAAIGGVCLTTMLPVVIAETCTGHCKPNTQSQQNYYNNEMCPMYQLVDSKHCEGGSEILPHSDNCWLEQDIQKNDWKWTKIEYTPSGAYATDNYFCKKTVNGQVFWNWFGSNIGGEWTCYYTGKGRSYCLNGATNLDDHSGDKATDCKPYSP